MKFAGKLLVAALAAAIIAGGGFTLPLAAVAAIIYVKAKNPKTIKTNKERKR